MLTLRLCLDHPSRQNASEVTAGRMRGSIRLARATFLVELICKEFVSKEFWMCRTEQGCLAQPFNRALIER